MRIPQTSQASSAEVDLVESQPAVAKKAPSVAQDVSRPSIKAVLVDEPQSKSESIVSKAQAAAPAVAKPTIVRATLVDSPMAAATVEISSTATSLQEVRKFSTQEIVGAITSDISAIPTSGGYRVALLVVTLVMILLPIVYLALIVGLATGVGSYAYYGSDVLRNDQGNARVSTGALVAYFGPLMIGTIGVLFMIKPLFARSAEVDRRRSLDRRSDPALFAFVERLCKAVHAPKPKRIDVNCDVNASASFRRGMWSIFLSNDLVLTIGMPLVAGLTVRQFGGVLAHEFGHFSQGFGMRLTYIVRSISFWFARVVYQRDRWDEALKHMARTLDFRIGIVLHLARVFVWLTRRILWCLMMLGNIVSCYLLRQMEFDADLHEIRFAGSDAFIQTAENLRRLGVAYQQSLAEQQQFFLDGKLANDMPRLTQLNRDDQDQRLIEQIAKSTNEEKPSWHDTHPTDLQRIAQAQRQQELGIFHLEAPASILFADYASVCRMVTIDFFKEVFEEKLKSKMLFPVDQLVSHKTATKEARQALLRQFGVYFRTPRIMSFTVAETTNSDPQELLKQLRKSRDTMIRLLASYDALSKEFDQTDSKWLSCQQVSMLQSMGAKLKQSDFEVPVGSAQVSTSAADGFRRQLATMNDQLRPLEAAFEQRVAAAVRLVAFPLVKSKIGASAMSLVDRAALTLVCLDKLQAAYGDIAKMRNEYACLGLLLQCAQGKDVGEKTAQEAIRLSESLAMALQVLHDRFQSVEFPFEHAEGRLTMSQYLVPSVPAKDEIGDVLRAAEKCLEQYHYVYFRGLGSLALIVQHVESALGLPPQIDPPDPPDEPESLADQQ